VHHCPLWPSFSSNLLLPVYSQIEGFTLSYFLVKENTLARIETEVATTNKSPGAGSAVEVSQTIISQI
jgi:hypothetical protein